MHSYGSARHLCKASNCRLGRLESLGGPDSDSSRHSVCHGVRQPRGVERQHSLRIANLHGDIQHQRKDPRYPNLLTSVDVHCELPPIRKSRVSCRQPADHRHRRDQRRPDRHPVQPVLARDHPPAQRRDARLRAGCAPPRPGQLRRGHLHRLHLLPDVRPAPVAVRHPPRHHLPDADGHRHRRLRHQPARERGRRARLHWPLGQLGPERRAPVDPAHQRHPRLPHRPSGSYAQG